MILKINSVNRPLGRWSTWTNLNSRSICFPASNKHSNFSRRKFKWSILFLDKNIITLKSGLSNSRCWSGFK